MKPQTEKILQWLKLGHSITPIDALKMFGCFRLGARIHDLKRMGHKIKSELIERDGKHFAEYSI
jgi:hypothetical protein